MSEVSYQFKKLDFKYKDESEMLQISENLKGTFNKRRTIRTFSSQEVSIEIIKNCLLAASASPSGANKQPYKFVVISQPDMKKKVQEAAEKEEWQFYNKRASQSWLDDLKPFNTNHQKPYLSKAPHLIAIFAKPYDLINGEKIKNYYPIESTGIAIGALISALHMSGLATLTHTPSPLNFLNSLLNQPKHYKGLILLVVGYPEENTLVPVQDRKPIDELADFV